MHKDHISLLALSFSHHSVCMTHAPIQPVDPDSESSQQLVSQFGGQVHQSKPPLETNALNAIGKVRTRITEHARFL